MTPMRLNLLVGLFLTVGCAGPGRQGSSDLAQQPRDGAVAADLRPSYDLAVVTRDLAVPRDFAQAGGQEGDPCTTLCDCASGLVCLLGTCFTVGNVPFGCCTSPSCQLGSLCQSPDMAFGLCGFGGGLDAGLSGFCSLVPCSGSNVVCQSVGCSSCNGQYCSQ